MPWDEKKVENHWSRINASVIFKITPKSFKILPKSLPKWLDKFILPPAMYEGFSYYITVLTLGMVSRFNFCHCGECFVVLISILK